MGSEAKGGKPLLRKVPLPREQFWEEEKVIVTDEGIGEIESPEKYSQKCTQWKNPEP